VRNGTATDAATTVAHHTTVNGVAHHTTVNGVAKGLATFGSMVFINNIKSGPAHTRQNSHSFGDIDPGISRI
jgi:hypothetical protein